MRLLITGGAGFIGSAFIRHILSTYPNDSVVNLDALTYAGNLENVAEVATSPRYTFIKGDVADRDVVRRAMQGVDAVVHFAAESHVDRSIMDATPFVQTNVLGTQVLLDVARELGGIRFHHVSTDEVFGTLGPDDAPFCETTPYAPRSPYAASKAASDHLVRAAHVTHGLPITISNTSNNYGPYHFPEKLIPLTITNVRAGRPVPVYGDGLQKRDWLYVDDHVRGIDAALRQGRIGETYLFGADEDVSNLDLVRMILRLTQASQDLITFVPDRPGHDRRYATDSSKAHRELGWTPSMTLEQGLRATIDWYDAHADWVAHCLDGSYREYYARQYATL